MGSFDPSTEKQVIELKKQMVDLEEELDETRWKNKVLLAMCTLREHDYQLLCEEAGLSTAQRDRLRRKIDGGGGKRWKACVRCVVCSCARSHPKLLFPYTFFQAKLCR